MEIVPSNAFLRVQFEEFGTCLGRALLDYHAELMSASAIARAAHINNSRFHRPYTEERLVVTRDGRCCVQSISC